MDSVPKSPYNDAFFVFCPERVAQGGQEDVGSSEPCHGQTPDLACLSFHCSYHAISCLHTYWAPAFPQCPEPLNLFETCFSDTAELAGGNSCSFFGERVNVSVTWSKLSQTSASCELCGDVLQIHQSQQCSRRWVLSAFQDIPSEETWRKTSLGSTSELRVFFFSHFLMLHGKPVRLLCSSWWTWAAKTSWEVSHTFERWLGEACTELIKYLQLLACAVHVYTPYYIYTYVRTYVRTNEQTYIHPIPYHTLHYITLHYITYITYIAYIAYITYITHITHITYITLHCIALHYITLH